MAQLQANKFCVGRKSTSFFLGGTRSFDISGYNTAHSYPPETGKSYLKMTTGTAVILGTPTEQIIVFFSYKADGWCRIWAGKSQRQRQRDSVGGRRYARKEEETWIVFLFIFSFLFKSTITIVSCSWSCKQGHTKDPDLGGHIFENRV